MEYAQDLYEFEEDSMGENVFGNIETKSNGRREKVAPIDLVETMRSVRA